MVKVHSLPLAAVVLLLLATAHCRTPPPEEGEYDRGRFGDPYEIATNHPPAAPDTPPELSSDTLRVLLTYPGGCVDHEFDLDYEIAGDTSKIWLHHDARRDDCEAMLVDEVVMKLPLGAMDARTIVLLNPNDPEPFILRWGERNASGDRAPQ